MEMDSQICGFPSQGPRLRRQLAQVMALVLGASQWCPGSWCPVRTRPSLDPEPPPPGLFHHLVGTGRQWTQSVLWLTLTCHGTPKVLLALDSSCPHIWGHSPSLLPRLALTSGLFQLVSACSLPSLKPACTCCLNILSSRADHMETWMPTVSADARGNPQPGLGHAGCP